MALNRTPPAIIALTDAATGTLIPPKLKELYEKAYNKFASRCKARQVKVGILRRVLFWLILLISP